jgi:hypothetical protein
MDHQLQPPLRNFFFSSRRRTTRQRTIHQQQRGGGLPDWVWGGGLGVIVLIFVGGFLLFSQCSGASAACDKPLSALGQSSLDATGFVNEDAGLGHVIDFLNQGDTNAANTAFYGDVHNFMHNADPPIRAKNPNLAKNLCNAVIKLETDLEPAYHQTTATMAADAVLVRGYLDDGAVALGYPRPGS